MLETLKMPLGTVYVSAVGGRPRAWTSQTDISAKDVQGQSRMNHKENTEFNNQYYSPTLNKRTLDYGYELPGKSPKKDKKWSIGSLFRRKKKDASESSSDEDKKGFLPRRRKKSEKRKKSVKNVGTFDHVVLPPGATVYSTKNNNNRDCIFSEYSPIENNGLTISTNSHSQTDNNCNNNYNCGYANSARTSKESLEDVNNSRASLGSNSADGSVTRKSRKELTKARAVARRTSFKRNSSSDEESLSSKFRSDESLTKGIRDVSTGRKSRSARTERYFKRHSKDGENPLNYIKISDTDSPSIGYKFSDDGTNRSPSKSPIYPVNSTKVIPLNKPSSSSLGLSTIPPSHGNINKYNVSNSTSNPSYKPPLSINEYNNRNRNQNEYGTIINPSYNNYMNSQRSVSYDANIHKTSPMMESIQPNVRSHQRQRNLSLVDSSQFAKCMRQPPPPPPRDPRRLINGHDNSRPNTYFFENNNQCKSNSFNGHLSSPYSGYNSRYLMLKPNLRSTSEDPLPKDNNNIQLLQRPSSTTPDCSQPQRYVTRRLEPNEYGEKLAERYQYLTDKKPRSRKPIFIQPTDSVKKDPNEGMSTKKALDFWKQKEGTLRSENNVSSRRSPQMFTSQTHLETKLFLPNVLHCDSNKNTAISLENSHSPNAVPESERLYQNISQVNGNITNNRPVEYKQGEDDDAALNFTRKSSNLEDALNELEAIYNSLKLGDEDLLERAEKREKDMTEKKYMELHAEPYIGNGISRGALSDSSFSYEPYESLDSPRRRKVMKKLSADRKNDDMAYRKLNKEKPNNGIAHESSLSRVSYLLASPVHGVEEIPEPVKIGNDEPDVTLDDVVYRNVKHANNTLKVIEPQPPFGIPLGPITPAPNSDYLHAVPDEAITVPTFKRRKVPDIVKDDLAFRNLRKDRCKESPIPHLSNEDLTNNNNNVIFMNQSNQILDLNNAKKRRAVRSLSANIGSLMYLEADGNDGCNNNAEKEFQNLTDIADAMEIARKVLKERDNKITATRRAFLSDTESKTLTNGNHTSTETLTESRLNFLNELRGDQRYSSGCKNVKASLNRSEVIDACSEDGLGNASQDSSLENLLNAMAAEAKETTDRITRELKQLAEMKERSENEAKHSSCMEGNEHLIDDRVHDVIDPNVASAKNKSLERKLLEIDAVSEQAKLCEKFLETVVDSAEQITIPKQLTEEVETISEDPLLMESVASIVLSRVEPDKVKNIDTMRNLSESEHDYENLMSDKELNVCETSLCDDDVVEPVPICRSPYEEKKSELIATFQDMLKQEANELDCIPKEEIENKNPSDKGTNDSKYQKILLCDSLRQIDADVKSDTEVTGEPCVNVVELPASNECVFSANPNNTSNNVERVFISNCDITISHLPDSGEAESELDNSKSSLDLNESVKYDSMSFGEEDYLTNNDSGSTNLDSLESLVSPKLVLATENLAKQLNREKSDEIEDSSDRGKGNTVCKWSSSLADSNVPGTSSSSSQLGSDRNGSNNDSDPERKQISRNACDALRLIFDKDPTRAWYCDPASVALLCGAACAQQLSYLDLCTIFAIFLALISFFAAMITI